ncbi:Ppx/GppA family phosphatase [Henriciella barbarensis]|uniref:Ppx/GppA family phosphatase n=1 Tax=Henriciella barbarensis TaxID=86342 RepID=A0A399QVL2_9PROT|nr:Ppx/GppA phosphatase family protein [Henriciella barbarensis]RIJ22314.1 Ppx/GppA family phosphatase [Henriciella barbarensis]
MADKKSRGGQRRNRRPARTDRRPPLYAAVDLGTNNCRLLVAAPTRKGFNVVDSHSQIARLGEGLEQSGRLSDVAMDRAFDALSAISKKLKAKRVGHVRCIATEACRKAENGAEFITQIRERTGLTFKIIGPQEEARLALIGCHNLIDDDAKSVLVLDIGGGSTELSLVDAAVARDSGLDGMLKKPPIKAWTSVPLGVVTLTEAFDHLGSEEEAYPAMLERAKSYVEKWAEKHDIRRMLADETSHIIGTSGTVTCVAGVHFGLEKYRRDLVDGQWMDHDGCYSTMDALITAGPEGRAKFPTIGHDRAGLMLAGCALMDAVWSLAPHARMRVADRGLREGLLLSMMKGPKRKRSRGGRKRKLQQNGSDKAAAEAKS